MIATRVLRYKILEYCLEVIFQKITKNFHKTKIDRLAQGMYIRYLKNCAGTEFFEIKITRIISSYKYFGGKDTGDRVIFFDYAHATKMGIDIGPKNDGTVYDGKVVESFIADYMI